MAVHEAGCDDVPLGVNLFAARTVDLAYGCNAAARDSDIAPSTWRTGTVDNQSVSNNQIELHGTPKISS
jgi:hypothetical protein